MADFNKVVASATWPDGKGNLFTVRVWANGQVRLTNGKSVAPHSLCTITFMRHERLGTDAWNRVLREALTSSKDSKDLVQRLNKQTKLNWTAA